MNTNIQTLLEEMNLSTLDDAYNYCLEMNIDPKKLVIDTQPIAFDNACDAYTLGSALALYRKAGSAAAAANIIGEGLQAFCKKGSVAAQRQVGLGHGALAARLLSDELLSLRKCNQQVFL